MNSILWLVGIFAVAILIISRWKGLRSLLSMSISLAIIIGYIIPHILAGGDPLQVSITGSIVLLTVTLYLTYGWNLKTHADVLGMSIVLLITGVLAGIFVSTTRLTGSGDENALFLLQMRNTRINLRGLLLGGMIIGSLGVLDDLVTTQSSAVFELRHLNPSLGFGQLFRSVMRIGQDHVAATVNMLVLAYAFYFGIPGIIVGVTLMGYMMSRVRNDSQNSALNLVASALIFAAMLIAVRSEIGVGLRAAAWPIFGLWVMKKAISGLAKNKIAPHEDTVFPPSWSPRGESSLRSSESRPGDRRSQ